MAAGVKGTRVAIGVGVVVAALVVGAIVGTRTRPRPVASGRGSDACPAEGKAGLVGFDAADGEQRWTNVVGDNTLAVTAEPGGRGRVRTWEIDGQARTVQAASGAVTGCRPAGPALVDDGFPPAVVDASGAIARQSGGEPGIEVVEADGRQRWFVAKGLLLGATEAGVVVDRSNHDGWRADGGPAYGIEVLDPATGAVRWRDELPGQSAVVVDDLLVVGDEDPPDFSADPAGAPTVVTAFDLADGRRAWRAETGGHGRTVYPGGDLVLVVGGLPAEVTALDAATGEERWTSDLPNPGAGGRWTDFGGTKGAVVLDGVVVVATEAAEPHRD